MVLSFNTFPKMGIWWIPPGTWGDPFHNPIFIQFFHRMTAYLVLLLIGSIWWQSRRANCDLRQQRAILITSLASLGQIALGIATLLTAVPIALGSLHQVGALLLFGCSISLCHTLRPFEPSNCRNDV